MIPSIIYANLDDFTKISMNLKLVLNNYQEQK